MDLVKFYSWKRASTIVALAGNPLPAECCKRVFDGLWADGLLDACTVEVVRWGNSKRANAPGVNKQRRQVKVPGYSLNAKGKRALSQARRDDRRLLNELVTENSRLVRRLVGQVFTKTLQFVEEEDLYQVGLMALSHALGRFDPEEYAKKKQGASFATYLREWVRDYTQKETSKQQPIHHPRGFGMPYAVHKKAEEILRLTGAYATAAQLGSYTVRSKGKTRTVQITEDMLLKWRAAQNSVVPLDTLQNAQTRQSFVQSDGDFIEVGGAPAPSSNNPDALYLAAERRQEMDRILSLCTDSERLVVTAIRNGEGSDKEVGKLLGKKQTSGFEFKQRLVHKLTAIAKAV